MKKFITYDIRKQKIKEGKNLSSINLELIKKAMDERKSISAYYKNYFRKLSPYELGTKKGKYRCLFYQYGGKSSSGVINSRSKHNWRCMELNKLKKLQILDEPLFKPNILSHKKPSKCIEKRIKRIMIN